jgi:hypothetical protein
MKRNGKCGNCHKTMRRCECGQEIQKCKDDPYYFFTEYCTINGERPAISEERFNEIWEQYNNSSNSVLLIKNRIK